MAEVLLLGMTHFPRLRIPDEQWSRLILRMLSDPGVPEHMKDPKNWPEAMRKQWGEDQGLTAAREERRALMADFKRMQDELERFKPDFVVMWGDDQYENFREDGVAPFAILAYDEMPIEVRPQQLEGPKIVDPPLERVIAVSGHRQGAKHLTSGLIEKGFDITYAYKPRHVSLSHSFLNTILYLGPDDATSFPWKAVPFSVNCYGRIVLAHKGMPRGLSHVANPDDMDPPAPPPWRCFDLGRACAQVAAASSWRVALVATSSWSHGFFTRKNFNFYPDMEADLSLYNELVAGNYDAWRSRQLPDIEASGQQEVLNWMCLAGAFAELKRKPRYANFHESYIFNSPKVFVAG